MTTYHINRRGEPGICRAVHGQCPFGTEDDHFPSAEAAYDKLAESYGGSFSSYATNTPLSEARALQPKDSDTQAELKAKQRKAEAMVSAGTTNDAIKGLDVALKIEGRLRGFKAALNNPKVQESVSIAQDAMTAPEPAQWMDEAKEFLDKMYEIKRRARTPHGTPTMSSIKTGPHVQ